jgi:hypothetical protein
MPYDQVWLLASLEGVIFVGSAIGDAKRASKLSCM